MERCIWGSVGSVLYNFLLPGDRGPTANRQRGALIRITLDLSTSNQQTSAILHGRLEPPQTTHRTEPVTTTVVVSKPTCRSRPHTGLFIYAILQSAIVNLLWLFKKTTSVFNLDVTYIMFS